MACCVVGVLGVLRTDPPWREKYHSVNGYLHPTGYGGGYSTPKEKPYSANQ